MTDLIAVPSWGERNYWRFVMGATIGVTYPLLMVPLLGLKVRGDSCQSEYLAWIAYVLLRLGVAFPRAYSYCEHPLGCEEDVKDLWDRLSITFFDLVSPRCIGRSVYWIHITTTTTLRQLLDR